MSFNKYVHFLSNRMQHDIPRFRMREFIFVSLPVSDFSFDYDSDKTFVAPTNSNNNNNSYHIIILYIYRNLPTFFKNIMTHSRCPASRRITRGVNRFCFSPLRSCRITKIYIRRYLHHYYYYRIR